MPVRRLCGYLSGSFWCGLTITDAGLRWAKDECGVLALRSVTMSGCRAFVSCVFAQVCLGAGELMSTAADRVAIVVGGAFGIGWAVLRRPTADGCQVTIADRDVGGALMWRQTARVSLTSLNARQPAAGMSAYCAAKPGLAMLTLTTVTLSAPLAVPLSGWARRALHGQV
jgi:hypothetical protein